MYHFHTPTLLIQFHKFSSLCVKVLPLIIFVRLQSVKPAAVLSRVGYQYINIEWWQSKCHRENILFCIKNINCEKQYTIICRSFSQREIPCSLFSVYMYLFLSVFSRYKPQVHPPARSHIITTTVITSHTSCNFFHCYPEKTINCAETVSAVLNMTQDP